MQELEQLKARTWFLDRVLRPSVNAVYTAGLYHSSVHEPLWQICSACACIGDMACPASDACNPYRNAWTRTVLNSAGGHVQRLLPLMVAELARRDKFAACLAGPSVYDHRWALESPWLLGDSHLEERYPVESLPFCCRSGFI